MTLTEFLLARIAEDEREWRGFGPCMDCATDPARVLAECEAKRRMIESHLSNYPRLSDAPDHMWFKYLAAVYADHPDYRAEWAA